MRRALELAQKGLGTVSPNPMVGCVIVHNDKIIGEGWTQPYGGAHAEVQAIINVKNKESLVNSSAYVTLEPCAHFGKTPPCADLLIQYKIKKVIVACSDPNPLVAGKGIKKLKEAGIEVQIGLMEKEGLMINRRFFTSINKERPYIILKWAQSSDGFIARENYDSKWISNSYSRKLVHKWRVEEDAILVGTNTAKYDDPKLNVRDWQGKDPLRIVIDNNSRLPKTLNLYDNSQPTICYNLSTNTKGENLDYVKLNKKHFIEDLLADLHKRKIKSIIIEGGSKLINTFIEKKLCDEARVFTSYIEFGKGITAPEFSYQNSLSQFIKRDKLTTTKA
jgi:diaminohydroxyphosphoribosylaminopyrimidine deaminase/5-amino-6-(5-phosphoribosylamino)uracil reductase